MRVTIVPSEGIVTLDGVSYIVDSVRRLANRFHAIQWDGTKGHVEYNNDDLANPDDFRGNERITTIQAFQPYIAEALAQVGVPVPTPEIPLPVYAYRKRQQIAFTQARTANFGVQYSDPLSISMLTALVALFDKALLSGSINYKGPNGFISLTGAEVLALAGQIAAHVQKAFNAEKAILEEIAMGTITTTEQIDAAFTTQMNA